MDKNSKQQEPAGQPPSGRTGKKGDPLAQAGKWRIPSTLIGGEPVKPEAPREEQPVESAPEPKPEKAVGGATDMFGQVPPEEMPTVALPAGGSVPAADAETETATEKIPAETQEDDAPGESPAPATAPPGEFTQLFRPSADSSPAEHPTVSAPARKNKEQPVGEFTRMFLPGELVEEEPEVSPEPARPAEGPEYGAFTSMFRPTEAASEPETTISETPKAPSGEFTRMFRAPEKTDAAPEFTGGGPVQLPKKEIGDFTRMFRPPRPPSAEEPPAYPGEPLSPKPDRTPPTGRGEFTRYFQSPLGEGRPMKDPPAGPPRTTPEPPKQEAGEYTRLFKAPPEASEKSSKEATQAFRAPQISAAPGPAAEPPATVGPSEFTRIIRPGEIPAEPAPAPVEEKPPETTPLPPKKKRTFPVALIIVLGVLLLIAIGLVVFALLKH